MRVFKGHVQDRCSSIRIWGQENGGGVLTRRSFPGSAPPFGGYGHWSRLPEPTPLDCAVSATSNRQVSVLLT
jgi:hypothetical protein